MFDETTKQGLTSEAGVNECNDPWRHRSKKMICLTCMWFVEKQFTGAYNPNNPKDVIGRCRRHSPTMNGYPVVYCTDWCGDHKLDENKI